MALKNNSSEQKFISILSDGKFHLTVPEGTEGAVKREYETSDGTKGVKHELVYTEVSGLIADIKFYEGDYGKLLQITIDDDGDVVVVSVNTSQNFGEDLLKKLPAIDRTVSVVLSPYSFTDEKGKQRKGVTVKQNDVKVENFYYDKTKKENINGYPNPDFGKKKKISNDDWKAYFLQARIFLIDDVSQRLGLATEEEEF